jgi:hypothetical protein
LLTRHLEQENPRRNRRIDGIASSTHWDANYEIRSLKQLAGASVGNKAPSAKKGITKI